MLWMTGRPSLLQLWIQLQREIRDIQLKFKDHPELQRRAFLRLWKNRFGTDATYGNLLKVCLENENAICAKVITDVLSEEVTVDSDEETTYGEDYEAEKPIYDDTERYKLYRSRRPKKPPRENTSEYNQLQKFCSKVEIILQTVDEHEYQAAVTFMEPPAKNFTKAVVFPTAGMVVGTFAEKKTALIQTDAGASCSDFVEDAITTFPNAQFVIAVGVSYAFDTSKFKLGDVLVSNKISDLANLKFDENGEMRDRGNTIDVVYGIRKIFCMDLVHDPDFNVSANRSSKVYCGRLASYSHLMKKLEHREKFHTSVPTTIGGEIEGGELLKFEREGKIKGLIVIKGVADYADTNDTRNWKFTAAMAALHYVRSKLLYVPGTVDPQEDLIETEAEGEGEGEGEGRKRSATSGSESESTPPDEDSRILKRLISEVTCSLCLDIFTEPKRLPCEHVFCTECIRGLLTRSNTVAAGRITCPECRRETKIPNNDISKLSTPHQVNRLIEMYQENLETAKKRTNSLAIANCKIHTSEALALYCETCRSLVCRDCVLTSCVRKNHKHGFIEEMTQQYQSDFATELNLVKTLHQKVASNLESLAASEKDLQSSLNDKLKRIEFTFDAISELVTQERAFFTKSVEQSFQDQNELYLIKRGEISDVMAKLDSLIKTAETAFQDEPKPAFLAAVTTVKQQIERTRKTVENLSPYPTELPQIDMDLLNPEEFKDLCYLKDFIHMKGDPLQCHMERGVDLQKVQRHEITDIVLYVNPCNAKKGKVSVSATLYCKHSGATRNIKVKKMAPEKYSLLMVPIERGKHELRIKCNDKHICGSPIPLYVTIQPHNLKAVSTKEIKNISAMKCYRDKIYATVAE